MVLLTYHDETLTGDEDTTGKGDCPKTAYIDKLYGFNEEYANEERCDLFFICQDGEIPAHRLVISNASKYIMAMQDDQPPWFPIYISVPDLTKEIVSTLVRLAYTGQMNTPPGITSDELLDAMQALGWVHTDCLTASYLDTSGASADDEFGASISSKTAESLETVLKMNFPIANKGEADTSDDEMEMALPDVPLSDDDEGKLVIATEPTKKKEGTTRRTRQAKKPKTQSPSKNKPTTTNKRNQSPKQAAETPKPSEDAPSSRKGSRKSKDDAVNTTPTKDKLDKQPETPSSTVEGDAEPLRSRTRTIRKPKKFDDLIVMTPTKRKDSPTKSPSKPAPKNLKANSVEKEVPEVTPTPKKGAANKKVSNDVNPAPPGSKSRRSTSSESKDSPRNSLITSYFSKRSPRKSNDTASESEKTQDCANSERNGNNVQNDDGDAGDVSTNNVIDITEANEKDAEAVTNKSTSNAAATRKRARSTASTKSDKEATQDDIGTDTETSAKSRRRRNQGNSEVELEEQEKVNPVKRGRKASTMSNASKASNKDITEPAVENDEEGATETPRKRRSRQE